MTDPTTLIFDSKKRGAFRYAGRQDRLSYRPSGKLSPGSHSVKIVVRDGQGLRDNRKWNFKVKQRNPGNDGSIGGGPFAEINAPGFPFNVLPDGPIFDVFKNRSRKTKALERPGPRVAGIGLNL